MKKLFTFLFLMIALIGNKVYGQNLVADGLTFRIDVFQRELVNSLAPTTVGYQFVLVKDGKIVSERFGGKARRGNDGDLNMKPTTPINIGSLFKFVSGTGMLNLMEKTSANMDQSYKKLNFDQRLDRPIWGEFPKVWLDVIAKPTDPGPTQRSIKFRQLLQHRSGFDNDWNKDYKGGRPFIYYLADGFTPSQYNVREYANMNFVTVGHLIPLIEQHNLNYDLDIHTSGWTQAKADGYIRQQTGLKMDKIMRDRIWNKMTPKFDPSCDPKTDMKETAAYGYESPTDNAGVLTSSIENRGYCGGEGGYYMSARDFANYVSYFSQTNVIVTKTVRDKMYNDTMDADDRLVWAGANSDGWMKQKFNMPRIAWSNGATDGTRTVLMRLPNNFYLIIFSNTRDDSKGWSPGQLYNFGADAFKAGMEDNFK